jgi:TRAP-type C4-dicarboxylate transport system permease small subunit
VLDRPLAAPTRALAIVGGLLSVTLALIVTVHISLRWLFNSQVPGDIELVQIGTALSIFAFFPLCQSRRGNIVVDSFTTRLSPRAREWLDAVWDLVYAAAAFVIAWRLAIGAWDTMRSNTVSMILGLPTGWAVAACAAASAFLGIVAVATSLRLIRGEA